MFKVYAVSLGGTRRCVFKSEDWEEALSFCLAHEWSWLNPVDPLGYEWDLMIEEGE